MIGILAGVVEFLAGVVEFLVGALAVIFVSLGRWGFVQMLSVSPDLSYGGVHDIGPGGHWQVR